MEDVPTRTEHKSLLKNFTGTALDEIVSLRDEVLSTSKKVLGVESDLGRQLNGTERRLNDSIREIERHLEMERKEADKAHSERLRDLEQRIVQLEKEQAVSKAKAGGIGALAGGGLGGLILLLEKVVF